MKNNTHKLSAFLPQITKVFFIVLILNFLGGCVNDEIKHIPNKLRAPAYPLITIDPYINGWAFGDTKPLHVLGMAAIGLARLSLILAPLAWFNHSLVWFFPIGLLHGLVYYCGNKWLFKYDIPLKWNEARFTDGGTSWGEILTGAVFGAVFACVYLTA